MSSIRQRCPVCGTWTESQEVVKNGVIRNNSKQYAKKTVSAAIGSAGAAKGAAIGTALCPGFGTVIGGLVGFVAGMGAGSMVNAGVDFIVDNVEHSFHCPNCAHHWQTKAPDISDTENSANIRSTSHTQKIRTVLMQEIKKCTQQTYLLEGNSLICAGLEDRKIIDFLNILKRKYNIVMYATDIKSCRTIKDVLDRIITEHPEIQYR